MNRMICCAKRIVLAIIAALFAAPVLAAVCTSDSNGNWNAKGTWGTNANGCVGATGGIPGAMDDVTIRNGDTVTITANAAAKNVTVGQGASGILRYDRTGNFSLTVGGNFTVSAGATVTMRTGGAASRTHSLLLKGNFSNGGTVNTSMTVPGLTFILNVTMNGTTAQTIGGTTVTNFYNLTINNTGGDVAIISASAALSPMVDNALTLTSGHVITTVGTNNLGSNTAGTVSGGSAASHVVGDMLKSFPGGNSSFTFPIGDGTNYQPVTVVLTGATAGTLSAWVDSGDHPDTIANLSRIDQTRSANHYWTLTPGTLATYTKYDATFQFDAAIDATATAGNFIVARKKSGAWTRPTVGLKTATTIEITDLTSGQGFGEFAVGELLSGVYKGVNQLIDLREIYE